MRKSLTIVAVLSALLLAACQPAPPPVTHTEDAKIVDYAPTRGFLQMSPSTMGRYRVYPTTECYDNRASKMVQFSCNALDSWEGHDARITWQGNAAAGETRLHRVVITK